MKSSHGRLGVLAAAAGMLLGLGQSVNAQSIVYGAQAATGQILEINPLTGAVVGSFAAPTAIGTHVGLTYAQPLNQVLFINSDVGTNLYRLNADTGAVSSTVFGDSFQNHGVSYERLSGVDNLYYTHDNADVHHQTGFGGSTNFFFTNGTPAGGLGGDGYGREFGIFTDGIHEYNPTSGTLIASLVAPSGLLGLAFDGVNLYASNNQGQLLTLNASTGAILNTVNVAGGSLIELGARFGSVTPTAPGVPEPSQTAALGLGLLGLAGLVLTAKKRKASHAA